MFDKVFLYSTFFANIFKSQFIGCTGAHDPLSSRIRRIRYDPKEIFKACNPENCRKSIRITLPNYNKTRKEQSERGKLIFLTGLVTKAS